MRKVIVIKDRVELKVVKNSINGLFLVFIPDYDQTVKPDFTGFEWIVTSSPWVARHGNEIYHLVNGEVVRAQTILENRVIYGDILTSVSTGLFGDGLDEPEHSKELRQEKISLQALSNQGLITSEQKLRLNYLRSIFNID